ncbi:MAG: type 1 glutamine amidotransferase [Bacteroidota bacterium]
MPASMDKTPSLDNLKLLLIQARTDPAILDQEMQCFVERCRVAPHQIASVNVCMEPLPDDAFSAYDAIFIGGAGEFSAKNDYDWMPALLALVQTADQRAFPLLGSCWGHQIIARALGGKVIYDKDLTEMGCHWIELNTAGQQDTLFKNFPTRFKANMGHHDRVSVLPQEAVNLAFSDTQSNQAFRIADKPIYGTQFHSELDAAREKERLYAYRDHYTEVETEEAFQEIIAGLAKTTEVDELLYKFLVSYVAHPTR